MADSRLIVALDVKTDEEAIALVEKLGDSVCHYKVGMELFYRSGGNIVRRLRAMGKEVFLDLKLHDIGNTVAEGLVSLLPLGMTMMNVHASGGFSMMKAAVTRLREAAAEMQVQVPKLIAVTVLTSIGTEEWVRLGETEAIENHVVRLAKLAKEAGLDGVVASPYESAAIRQACGDDFLIVTPGIRPAGSSIDDQNRIATPASAIANGSTHIVVGRPVRTAADPVAAAESIIKEMEGVQK